MSSLSLSTSVAKNWKISNDEKISHRISMEENQIRHILFPLRNSLSHACIARVMSLCSNALVCNQKFSRADANSFRSVDWIGSEKSSFATVMTWLTWESNVGINSIICTHRNIVLMRRRIKTVRLNLFVDNWEMRRVHFETRIKCLGASNSIRLQLVCLDAAKIEIFIVIQLWRWFSSGTKKCIRSTELRFRLTFDFFRLSLNVWIKCDLVQHILARDSI